MKRVYRFPLKQNIGEAAVPVIVEGETIIRGWRKRNYDIGGRGAESGLFAFKIGYALEVD